MTRGREKERQVNREKMKQQQNKKFFLDPSSQASPRCIVCYENGQTMYLLFWYSFHFFHQSYWVIIVCNEYNVLTLVRTAKGNESFNAELECVSSYSCIKYLYRKASNSNNAFVICSCLFFEFKFSILCQTVNRALNVGNECNIDCNW